LQSPPSGRDLPIDDNDERRSTEQFDRDIGG